jgi:hypothetical protein
MVRQQRALLDTAITITLVGVPIGTQALVGAGTNETRPDWPGRLETPSGQTSHRSPVRGNELQPQVLAWCLGLVFVNG